MMGRKTFFCVIVMIGCIHNMYAGTIISQKKHGHCGHEDLKKLYRQRSCGTINNFLRNAAPDMVRLNLNLISYESLIIIALSLPPIIATRYWCDEKLQSYFYDDIGHRNIHQCPEWMHTVGQCSIGVPLVFFGLEAFIARDMEFRITCQEYLLGWPFVFCAKKLFKLGTWEFCRRPWHEKFSKKERSFGGFPSGHIAELAYAATLFGMRFGPRYALPLGATTLAVGGIFLNCNRHYLSQMLAGATLGALYAVAVNKLVDTKLSAFCELSMSYNGHGPCLQLAGNF